MENTQKTVISVHVTINEPIERVWKAFTTPEDVQKWNAAHESWHCPAASNDLHVGGKFNYRMEARDGSMGFDFWGIYDEIKYHELIAYTMGDERKVTVKFLELGKQTEILEAFEAETENSPELQQTGWQAILDNFKNYVEMF